MRFNRLLKLLQTFSPDERKRFRRFIGSPYHYQGRNAAALAALFDFCLNSFNQSSECWPNTAQAYAALFPEGRRVTGKLDKRINSLYEMATRFLISEQTFKPENNTDQQLLLAEAFQQRKLYTESEALLHGVRSMLDREHTGTVADYQKRYRLVAQEINQKILSPSKHAAISPNEGFETAYLSYQAMKYDIAIATHALHDKILFIPSEQAQKALNEAPLPAELAQKHPLLFLSSRFVEIATLPAPRLDLFEQFVHAISQFEHLLLPADVRRVWGMTRNILISWWHKNKDWQTLRLYFDLVLAHLSKGYLYFNGEILRHTLDTICKTGLVLGQAEIVYKVLTGHRGKIAGEPEDGPFYRYCMARYYFYTQRFEEAYDLLPQNLADPSYQTDIKTLEIQILYEVDSPLLPFRMDAFRLFLRRSALKLTTPERLTALRHFFNALSRIHRCPNGKTHRANSIIDQIKNTPGTAEYVWLLNIAAKKRDGVATPG